MTTRILIVEDEPLSLGTMRAAFEGSAFEVLTASNGLAGLLHATADPIPDLIITDVTMPTLDGFGMAKRIRLHPKARGVPIIFLTAQKSPNDVVSGLQLGASCYLAKPFTPSQLLEKVREVLKREEIAGKRRVR